MDDIDALARPHDKLVNGVVDDFFEQNIDAVILVRAVAQPADIHAGPLSDMLQRTEGLDLAFVVIMRRCIHMSAESEEVELWWSLNILLYLGTIGNRLHRRTAVVGESNEV